MTNIRLKYKPINPFQLMKKLLILIAAVFATVSAMADSKVTQGDVNVLNDNSVTFSIEYDFSKAVVEGKPYKQYLASRDADWNRDWPNDQEKGKQMFVRTWNKKNKKGMQASEQKGGAYKLVIKPTSLHFGSAALSWVIGFGAGGMKMSGTMELYKGNKSVLVIEVSEQTGKSRATETQRFESLMEELAKDTYKDILK